MLIIEAVPLPVLEVSVKKKKKNQISIVISQFLCFPEKNAPMVIQCNTSTILVEIQAVTDI